MRFQFAVRSALLAVLLSPSLHAWESQRVPVWPGSLAPNGDGSTSEATTMLTIHRPEQPDFAILIYPVITMVEGTHGGPRDNLLGRNPARETIEAFSAEKQVSDHTPPVILAHAKDDTVVVAGNSGLFAGGMRRHRVPSEFLELDSGGHGLNGYQGPSWDAWQAACLRWLDSLGFLAVKSPDHSGADSAEKSISATDPRILRGLSPLNWICTKDAIHTTVCGPRGTALSPARTAWF